MYTRKHFEKDVQLINCLMAEHDIDTRYAPEYYNGLVDIGYGSTLQIERSCRANTLSTHTDKRIVMLETMRDALQRMQDAGPKEKTGVRFLSDVRDEHVAHIPSDIWEIAIEEEIVNSFQEELWVFLVNTRNEIKSKALVGIGTADSALVDIAAIMRVAIVHGATQIVMMHNHPSGHPDPSPEDVRITALIKRACDLFDINLLDHVIVGTRGYVSLKERQLFP